jgi:Mrp family chromosome partitioning ATPase
MSKRTTRFGEKEGTPLPLVTQPMVAVTPANNPTHQVSPHVLASSAASTPGVSPSMSLETTVSRAPADPNDARALVVSRPEGSHIAATRQPPEIGLTQHHLPDDAPLDPRLVLVRAPDGDRAAAFRVLRHHLLEAGRPQVVVVSSPRADEGKTTTAINLALALAECGRAKVLLVEANVRRPQLSSIFRVVPPWCFAEQLAAHRHQPLLPWSFVDIPQLWLHLAAINPRIEQSQLLDAPAFAIAMERLRLADYDHIVIDCPSVLGSADVNLIQDAGDGVVLSLRGKRTTARELRRAIEQLSPAKIIGTVLIEG